MTHYLDHASTSPPRPEVVAACRAWLEGDPPAADPGRAHRAGRLARAAIEEGREQVAAFLGVRPRQVVFTSSGTEAANSVVWGAVHAHPGAPIVLADVEHAAVRDASARWAAVTTLPVDHLGRLVVSDLEDLLDRSSAPGGTRPALVHCQVANHEVGTLQPVERVAELCASHGVALHVDACAAAGHLPLDFGALGAPFVSVSAHKLGGPPGIGALVVGRGIRLDPLLVGGAQERARRAGFENALGVVGFAAAATALGDPTRLAGEVERDRRRSDRLVASATAVEGVRQVGDPHLRLPHIVCFALDDVEGEPVLLGLDRAGICAHSGSACAAEAFTPSPVLAAMGQDPGRSLRLSVGWSTTDDDVAALGPALADTLDGLRRLRA